MQLYQRPEILLEIPENIEFHSDIFYSEDSKDIRQSFHLLKPKQQDKKLPLIIYIHGGAWHHGDKDLQIPHLIPYVESGEFVAIAINYRFSQQAPWPAQKDDCLAALNYALKQAGKYGIDTDRVAIWGSSSGAHLALHLANDSRINAVLAYCPPSHFRPLLDILEYEEHELKSHILPDSPVIQLIGQDPLLAPELLLDASPYEHLNKQTCPILLAHGTKDEAVPYDQSLAYLNKAIGLGVDCKLITLNNYEHKFTHPILDKEVRNFFDYQLLGKGYTPESLTLT